MWKSTGFSVGLTAGVLLMFGTAALGPARTVSAAPGPQGVDNQGKYALAVGGSEPNATDLLWVLHEHPNVLKDRGADTYMKPQQITLCLYKAERQGEKMKLIAARDIAYDIELQNLNQVSPPDARETYEIYLKGRKAAEKK